MARLPKQAAAHSRHTATPAPATIQVDVELHAAKWKPPLSRDGQRILIGIVRAADGSLSPFATCARARPNNAPESARTPMSQMEFGGCRRRAQGLQG